jgi:hypothetical protein
MRAVPCRNEKAEAAAINLVLYTEHLDVLPGINMLHLRKQSFDLRIVCFLNHLDEFHFMPLVKSSVTPKAPCLILHPRNNTNSLFPPFPIV